jgi:hypothetical protein
MSAVVIAREVFHKTWNRPRPTSAGPVELLPLDEAAEK